MLFDPGQDIEPQLSAYDELCEKLEKLEKLSAIGCHENSWTFADVTVHQLGPTQAIHDYFLRQAINNLLKSMSGEGSPLSFHPTPCLRSSGSTFTGRRRFCLGDTSHEAWNQSVGIHRHSQNKHLFGKAQIVKAPHHGSSVGQEPEFWDEVLDRAGHAVISAGHQYGHPSPVIVQKIVEIVGSKRFYCTNLCSEIKTHLTRATAEGKSGDDLHAELEWLARVGVDGKCVPYHGGVHFDISEDGAIDCRMDCSPPPPTCRWHHISQSAVRNNPLSDNLSEGISLYARVENKEFDLGEILTVNAGHVGHPMPSRVAVSTELEGILKNAKPEGVQFLLGTSVMATGPWSTDNGVSFPLIMHIRRLDEPRYMDVPEQ